MNMRNHKINGDGLKLVEVVSQVSVITSGVMKRSKVE